MVQFHDDAIVLSGITGTKLKCEILGGYYPTWWGITSGGSTRNYPFMTAILELNSGSGEDYIEDTDETILGSSGHALQLRLENPGASKLKVILVEDNDECYAHLKNTIGNRWTSVNIDQAEGPPETNQTGIYLIHKKLPEALDAIEKISLRNALFFFDPLLYTPWSEIERVARRRIKWYYQTQTEFIVFTFSSDWFAGRPKLGLTPLPKTRSKEKWTEQEKQSVGLMDEMFGNDVWQEKLLSDRSLEERVETLVRAYRLRLHRWFRYVLPLPFEPKKGQRYHLFVCSNYEEGIDITRRFYAKDSGNSLYHPDNKTAYERFAKLHPHLSKHLRGIQRPLPWKILWAVIKNHDEGLCDIRCDDLGRLRDTGKRGFWQLCNG